MIYVVVVLIPAALPIVTHGLIEHAYAVVSLATIMSLFFAYHIIKFYWTLRFYRAFGVHWAFTLFLLGAFIPVVAVFTSVAPIVIAFWIGISKSIIHRSRQVGAIA